MRMRWGLGPVFAFEWLMSSRHWQLYAQRSFFVACLLAGMAVIWATEVAGQTSPTIQSQALIGQYFYNAIVGIALALVLLAAPAATAGAVCLDKARGTLDHLLATDLSDAEIVLGKLAVRLVPTVGMVCCALPVMALGTLLGGIDPNALMGAFLVLLGIAVFGSALTLTFSVWGRKTHEVLMATYVVWVVWMLFVGGGLRALWVFASGVPAPLESLRYANPFFLAFAPYSEPGKVTVLTSAVFLVTCLVLSAALAALAVARLRPVALRQAGRAESARQRINFPVLQRPRLPAWASPSLDANPVLWREWHRKRPSRWSRFIWTIYVSGAITATFLSLYNFNHGVGPGREMPAVVNAFVTAIGMLLLSVAAATSLAEERVRGSLDVLLATPLSTATILWGKWWGAFRSVPCLALLPLFTASYIAADTGRWGPVFLLCLLLLAYGAGITSLGLGLATWVPRVGRAVGLTVVVYVFVTVAWVFLVAALFSRSDFLGPGLAMASPFFGGAFGTLAVDNQLGGPPRFRDSVLGWEIFWLFMHGLCAAGLFGATLATFDRCLGRVSDCPRSEPVVLYPRPRPKPAPILGLDESSVV